MDNLLEILGREAAKEGLQAGPACFDELVVRTHFNAAVELPLNSGRGAGEMGMFAINNRQIINRCCM